MRSTVISLALLFGSTLLLAAPGPAHGRRKPPAGPPLLPDLVPQAESLTGAFVVQENGRLLLRFATVLVNVGDGPIEVRGKKVRGKMVASQALYARNSKKPALTPFGEFTYHDEHGHWHLLQVAVYRLKDAGGAVVRTSDKVSFCLEDTALVHPDMPGASQKRRYQFCETRRFAKTLKSGISVGWCDIYAPHLPGQFIDVTGVPPGQYRLECVIDPEGVLTEKSRENNVASALVTL